MRIPWSHCYLSLTHYAFLILTSCRYHLRLVFFGQLIRLTLAKAVQILKERRNCPSKERWGWPPLMDYVATRLFGLSHGLPQYCLTEWFHQGSALFLPAGARREGARQERKLYHFLRAPKSFSLSITSWYTRACMRACVRACVCVCVCLTQDGCSGWSKPIQFCDSFRVQMQLTYTIFEHFGMDLGKDN